MATLIGPFSKGYSVNFYSGGDTTREAFRKHIDEIDRIYGFLNALDIGKVSVADESGLSGSISSLSTQLGNLNTQIGSINTALTNHINSSNPHPNYTPSVSWSNVSNKPNLADLSGNLPMSRITGNLDASRITNLPSGGSGGAEGYGITSGSLTANGYAKFGDNVLIVQWGKSEAHTPAASAYTENFPTSFADACYVLIPTGKFPVSTNDLDIQVSGWSKTGFSFRVTGSNSLATAYFYYIAIGK